jgi:hypothetical protein
MPAIKESAAPSGCHPLVEQNRRFQELMRAERSGLRQRYGVLRDDFIARHGGTMVRPLGLPLLFPERDFQELAAAGKTLLECQRKILRRLCSTLSVPEVLDFFHLPRQLDGLMDWGALLAGEVPMVRYDILASQDGGYRFCEFNVDTAVGGSESSELARLFVQALGETVPGHNPLKGRPLHPYACVGAMLAEKARAKGSERVVLLDWSAWADMGYFSFDLLTEAIKAQLGQLPVLVANETSYPAGTGLGGRDLVFRFFPFEDAQDDVDYLRGLVRSCPEVVCLFECEVLSSKRWFALFHDPDHTGCLSSSDRACIDEFVPHTFSLDRGNLARFLRDKDEYVLKNAFSYGGEGVHLGRDHTVEFFEALFQQGGHVGWVAQEHVEQPLVPVAVGSSLEPQEHRLVLAMYNVQGRDAGVFVRCHPTRSVINMLSGAHVGWAIVVDDEAQAQLLSVLPELR